MNFEATEDQTALRDSARAFAKGELTPNTQRWDAESHFPVNVLKQAGTMGFMGLYAPTEYGGLGLNRLTTAMILEALAEGCTTTAAYISIHNMATWMLCRWGNDGLRTRWAEALTAGEVLASYCLTEPNAGSDAAALATRAKKTAAGYRLEGNKAFISGAGSTDLLVVMARTGNPEDRAHGISAFAVPFDTPGISVGDNEKKMGWKAQPTRQVHFDGVEVDQDALLGTEGEGFKIAMAGLDGGRINIASCSLGAAQTALNRTRNYVQEREQFGQTLAKLQGVQFRLADMLTELCAARQIVYLAADKLDHDKPDKTAYCAMAKRFATDIGFKVCDEALQLHGGYGYLKDYHIEQLFRDTRVHQILEGANDVMRMIVARALLSETGEDLR